MIDYAIFLEKGATPRSEDKALFEEWKMGIVSNRECFKRFMANNYKPVNYDYYDEVTFVRWLHSLGY